MRKWNEYLKQLSKQKVDVKEIMKINLDRWCEEHTVFDTVRKNDSIKNKNIVIHLILEMMLRGFSKKNIYKVVEKSGMLFRKIINEEDISIDPCDKRVHVFKTQKEAEDFTYCLIKFLNINPTSILEIDFPTFVFNITNLEDDKARKQKEKFFGLDYDWLVIQRVPSSMDNCPLYQAHIERMGSAIKQQISTRENLNIIISTPSENTGGIVRDWVNKEFSETRKNILQITEQLEE